MGDKYTSFSTFTQKLLHGIVHILGGAEALHADDDVAWSAAVLSPPCNSFRDGVEDWCAIIDGVVYFIYDCVHVQVC